ncbi:MotA/TolQ/ExbB proton channel family protein [Desulfovibrio sp. OttesenSCG-928-C14]|nr:MotA/TolQ/ExbB proton channel family protein [Desulfovibrio sp. OttesenSCG-928-C14]
MDFATLFGIAFSLILVGLALGDVANFLNPAGLLIVLGGTFGAMLTNFPLRVVARAFGLIRKMLTQNLPDTRQVTEQFMEYAYIARREGILALEPLIKEIESPYLRKGMQILVDGLEPQAISRIMETEINNTESRNEVGVDLLNALASYAPALGLIGTVVGLVRMLSSMTDPSSIGPAMAIALLTTFYGAMLANLVFLPLCGKLRNRTKAEVFIMEMQLAGILGIAKGENPRLIREVLECYQAPEERGEAA